jgi:hypothetical protein
LPSSKHPGRAPCRRSATYNPRIVTKALFVLYLVVILTGIVFYLVIGGMQR